MKDLQRIQSERGSVGIPYFLKYWTAFNPAFQGIRAHPTDYMFFKAVWYDPDKDPFKT